MDDVLLLLVYRLQILNEENTILHDTEMARLYVKSREGDSSQYSNQHHPAWI
jgi:hypothetical protein